MEWIKVAEQDDAMHSNESFEFFENELIGVTGMTKKEFIENAETTNITDYESEYIIDGFKLEISADDPFWKLYELKTETT